MVGSIANSDARSRNIFEKKKNLLWVTFSTIGVQVPVDSDGKQIGFDTSTIKIAERLTNLVSRPELPGCCSAGETLMIPLPLLVASRLYRIDLHFR